MPLRRCVSPLPCFRCLVSVVSAARSPLCVSAVLSPLCLGCSVSVVFVSAARLRLAVPAQASL